MSAVCPHNMLTTLARYKNQHPPGAVLEPGTFCTENVHSTIKPQDDMYKPYKFYSLLSATHGNRAVQILANP